MSEIAFAKVDEKEVKEIMDRLKKLVYEYNKNLKGTQLYLKPYSATYKKNGKRYYYFGRHWYYLEYKDGKLRWHYIGSYKPASKLPDPPAIPEVTIMWYQGEYYMNPVELKRLKKFLGMEQP